MHDAQDSQDSAGLLELPVGKFLERTASASPTPGGGSVAALTGALASALVAMVARLTEGKKGYEQAWELAGEAVANADRLTADLQAAALEDVRSFEAYMAALRLPKGSPKGSPEERRARRAALAEATRRATAAPLAIAAACAEILTLAERLAPVANRHAVSDIGAAAHLAAAGAGAALLTAQINLGSAPDDGFFDDARSTVAKIRAEVDRISPSVIEQVENRV